MCSSPRPRARWKLEDPSTWLNGPRNLFTNWDQPLPLRVKLTKTFKNAWLRLSRRSLCCGNDGEPGC
jgi:hypothetical protein